MPVDFNYEQSIWGKGEAALKWSNPASFRLQQALFALEDLASASLVLEIGCGAGQFIRAIKKMKPELNCHGCDISQEAIRQAESVHDGVMYQVSEVARLPYKENSVSVVLIFDVLEHAQNVVELLREIKRILKPGGVVYSFVPCERDWLSWWNVLEKFGLKFELTKKFAGHINYFSRKSLLGLFKDCNFDIIRLRYSEHVIGQCVTVASFFMMARAAHKQGVEQINNETYFENSKLNKHSVVGRSMRKIINTLIYLESVLFSRIPSSNIHVTMIKKQHP